MTKPQLEKEIERLRAWLQLILFCDDHHATACARHALKGDPIP